MKNFLKLLKENMLMIIAVLTTISIIIIPLPMQILDSLLIFSLLLGIIALLATLYVKNPIWLAIFPTLILLASLFRVALNVATTRVILEQGHNGPESVSQVIAYIGNFVANNNFILGLIVFTFLITISFVVMEKATERVSDVSARYTLDEFPGQQMSIDAALNQGTISEEEAQKKRDNLVKKANLYGNIDGSNKFLKGEGVAMVIITLTNIVGGVLIGVVQYGQDIKTGVQTYALSTIGDGIIFQIPTLLFIAAILILITKPKNTLENTRLKEA